MPSLSEPSRTTRMLVRLTPAEKQAFQDQASQAGITVSDAFRVGAAELLADLLGSELEVTG